MHYHNAGDPLTELIFHASHAMYKMQMLLK